MTEKLYERFESGELTEMTEEIVEEIVANIVNECYYYTHIHPEEVMDEVASEKWNGYNLECIAKHYAKWKTSKWTEEACKIRAKNLSWNKNNDIDDIQYLTIMRIWDIEAEKRSEWQAEFKAQPTTWGQAYEPAPFKNPISPHPAKDSKKEENGKHKNENNQ